MLDPQANSDVQPSPVAMKQGDADQFLSLVSKKVSKMRGSEGSDFANLVNSKVSKLRDAAPTQVIPPPAAAPNELKQWNPNWHERLFGAGGFSGAVREARAAATGGDKTEVVKSFMNHPLAALDDLLFPHNPQSATGQVVKGALKAASGLTSPTQIAMMAVPAGFARAGIVEGAQAIHAAGMAMMPSMIEGTAQSVQRIKQARESGDDAAENEAWGDIAGNVAMMAIPHFGGKAIERIGYRELNEHAQAEHGKDFRKLDDNQKMQVMYKAAEDANPAFRKRIDQEVAKINAQKVPGKGGQTVGEERAAFTDDIAKQAHDREVRLQAARKAMNDLVRRHLAEEKFRQEHAKAEAAIHMERSRVDAEAAADVAAKAEYDAKAARNAESPSVAEQRGFSVSDDRATARGERGYITGTEREKYPVHAPGTAPEEASGLAVNDRRVPIDREVVAPDAARGIQGVTMQVTPAERFVQEYAEREHGASFSSLPLDQQRVVASQVGRSDPAQWKAFKQTPAYDAYRRHADITDRATPAMNRYLERNEGTGEPLAEGADPHIGVARLLLQRTDVNSTLKADPKLYQQVNEHSEKAFGQSFDALDESQKPAALAGFLRDNPDSVDSFASPDVTERLRNGQHVDLANMEANLRDKQQVSTLMEYRDSTRAALDEQFAGEVVRQVRSEHINAIQDLVRRAPAAETATGDSIATMARGLTRTAERINLDGIADKGDLFAVERAIRQVPEGDRSADMQQYLGQIRQLRAAAENELIRQYREGLISQMREDITQSRQTAAREVVTFEDQRHSADRLADAKSGEYATPEQKADAQALRDTAAFLQRKEDAAVAAVRVADGVKAQPVGDSIPMVAGRATYIELNSGERVPSHYAVVDMADLIASHDPLENFRPDPRYPAEAQPRDYQNEDELQIGVHERANAPNGDIYHADTIHPTDGPPIIRKDGVVISGNGREQSAELAASRGGWEPVRVDLLDKAQRFGINPEEIAKHKKPILVRVMDQVVTDPAELARYGTEMNRDAGMGQSPEEQAAALSRMLTPSVVERMANVFGSLSGDASLRTAMRTRAEDLGQILQDAGLVDPKKRAAYFESDGDLTESAKTLIENALMGTTVSEPAVLRRAPDDVKGKLGRVSMDFLLMRNAGSQWDLSSYNTDAVNLLIRARSQADSLRMMEAGAPEEKESLVDRLLHPESYRLSNMDLTFDGQATHPPVHPVTEAMAKALEESPREYSKIIGAYADMASGKNPSFFAEPTPWDAFNEHLGERYGVTTIPEEWGSVAGLPESIKEEIEAARGPMEVEPVTHQEVVRDDVQPDTSSVRDAMKGTEPRTISEFRDALARHPNISEEQAEAISETFSEILPRAIGQSFADILSNRRLSLTQGGSRGEMRGYTDFIDEANTAIHLFEKAEPSTVMHEMFHFLRRYLKPEHQAAFNEFVEAKPGVEWTVDQEEKAAQAFERYHFDGGRRRGALEKAFAVIHKAIQSVYDAVTGRGLVDPSPQIREMFDRWYDWTRTERKPITARVDVDALVDATKNRKVEIPAKAKVIDETAHVEKGAQNFVFTSREMADDFIDKNNKTIRTYQLLDGKDGQFYVRASFQPGTKRLYQGGMASIGDLARQAKVLEQQLKETTDPRIEARLRAQLNGIENKLGVSTYVFGGKPEVRNDEATQLIYGMGEMPSVHTPTTPAQAMQSRQVMGDPTAVEVAANGTDREVRALPDEASRLPESDRAPEVHGSTGEPDRRDEAAGQSLRGRKRADGGAGEGISTPDVNPLAKVPAASLKAPVRPRGTPVVEPEAWRGYADALGLPEGTPPPTVRIPDDLRAMMIYPGQAEAIEVALSGLQQHDAVMVAAPTGSGKTWQGLAIADQLLGQDASKVGLIITISQNLIHEADGYVKTGQQLGVQVDALPKDINEIAGGGVYAATYTGLRGNKDILSIPWDFVIFDEAAAARKWTESEQGKSVVLLGHAAKKVVYMSATPWHSALEVGYAHKLGLWPEGGFFEWGRQFGLRQVGPNSYSGGYAPKKMAKLRQQLIERGQWVSLHRDLDGVSAHVAMVPQTPEVHAGIKSVRDAFALAAKVFQQRGQSAMAASLRANEVVYLKRYIESARLPQVIEKAKQAIADGWYATIFSEYRSGSKEEVDGKVDDMFSKLPPGVGDHVRKMLPKLPNLVEIVRQELGENAAIFAGDANQLREEERTAFQNGKKKGLFTTYAAGGTGVSFHDRVGDKPRMGLFLGLPWSGIMFEQSQGRTWRYGTRSDVANVFFTSDTLPELKVLATKILPRMRALKASVYGEDMESGLSKSLRESTGIPEEILDYEEGNEQSADAAHFEQTVKGVGFTSADDMKMPRAKDAMNKGMKYKAQPKRLYQGPKNPLHEDASDAFVKLPLDSLPPSMRRAIEANRTYIQASAVDAAQRAVPGVEAPADAIKRVTKDSVINSKLMYMKYDVKKDSRSIGSALKEFNRILNTSGDRAVWQYFDEAGMGKEGKDIQRRLIERSHLITEHRGDMMAKVSDIVEGLNPQEHNLVVQVLEGKTASKDERINKAVAGYRKLFDDVRKQLGEAGAVFKSYGNDGKQVDVPWKDFRENPNYWPHMWDWNQKITFRDAEGKPYVKTLGDLHDMKPGEERDKLIEEYAAKRGINRIQAHEFFSKNRRTIKLAPNLERTRETSMPGYDTSMRAVGIYINQASEMLANIATVGQEREKINPAIHSLPTHAMRMVDSIVTADLNPLSVGTDNNILLRKASQWVVMSKMGMSVLKLPTHVILKTPLVTNTRSMVAGMLEFARHPAEVVRMSREAGILTDYVRQAMMMEYGLHDDSGLDRKLLKYTGFTSSIWLSRVIAGASGRHFLTVHAEPMLRKNPTDPILRRKLSDLYGYSGADLDRIATSGINEHDVKRAMIAGADWTTGSGRPSELPPVLRAAGGDHPIENAYRTMARLAFLLKTYTFKTANLVNRTVFDDMRAEGWKNKDFKPLLRLLVNGGASGLALSMLQMGVNSVANPAAAEEQKRRFAAIKDHPQGALWMEGANLSYALGIYPAKVLFDRLGTYEDKDMAKSKQQKRLENAFSEELGGILGSDLEHAKNSVIEFMETFEDDGVNHKKTPGERRVDIINRLGTQEVAPLKTAEGLYHIARGTSGDDEGSSSGPVLHRRVKHATHHRR